MYAIADDSFMQNSAFLFQNDTPNLERYKNMGSNKECRALHLTASLHVKYKRDKIINLVNRLDTISNLYKAMNNELLNDTYSIDSRHYLHVLDMKIDKESGYFVILIGNTDISGRDAMYASKKNVGQRRHFERENDEGHFSSAHLVISLTPSDDMPGLHHAVLEQCAGLNRSRVSSFITYLIEKYADEITTSEDKGKKPRPMFRLDVATDESLSNQADRIKIKTISVSANAPVDPTTFFEVEQLVRLKLTSPKSGEENARSAIEQAKEVAARILPGWKSMAMQVQRPDGHLVTLRGEGPEADMLAEAFQKIDVLLLDDELNIYPDRCIDAVVNLMARCLHGTSV